MTNSNNPELMINTYVTLMWSIAEVFDCESTCVNIKDQFKDKGHLTEVDMIDKYANYQFVDFYLDNAKKLQPLTRLIDKIIGQNEWPRYYTYKRIKNPF